MAEPAKTNGGNPSPDSAVENHNVGNRRVAIQNAAQEMLAIKAERKALNERAREVRQTLKEMGVQTPAFDYALRVADMEDEAKAEYLDSLRECFDGLDVGQQLDFLDEAVDRAQKTAAAAAE